MQYDLLYEREIADRYAERVQAAERMYRFRAAGLIQPTLVDRALQRLGDLLIGAGQRLKANGGWQPNRPVATARR
ncbi:MAG: hypothetical protein D6790_14655 [Caldilineae bacterium]|nr:MAG: hypothetical protein D6790_14655 [Caldilineae bacterium]